MNTNMNVSNNTKHKASRKSSVLRNLIKVSILIEITFEVLNVGKQYEFYLNKIKYRSDCRNTIGPRNYSIQRTI